MLDSTDLVHMVCDIVARGGNLLLNAGPTADGMIPAAQAMRFTALGWWLRSNGHAIYGTRPWNRPDGTTGDGQQVRFTRSDDTLHAIVLGTPPGGTLTIGDLAPAEGTEITMGGNPRALGWRRHGDDLVIETPDHLAPAPAYTFTISPSPADRRPQT